MAFPPRSRPDPHRPLSVPLPSHAPGRAAQDVILAIDDEDAILDNLRRVLTREGWVVYTVDDPVVAIEIYEAHWPEITLVLLDYFMHILRGDEVFDRLQRINPDVRVILTTCGDPDVAEKMLAKGLCGFLQKPLSPHELTGYIRAVLDSHPHRRNGAARTIGLGP